MVNTAKQLDIFFQKINLSQILNGYSCGAIINFQNALRGNLINAFPNVKWDGKEHKMFKTGLRDRIDIYGKAFNSDEEPYFLIIIEIDNTRADQVGKKIASRIAFTNGIPCIYIALCYPGNKSNKQECEKYFSYGEQLLKKENSKSIFKGYIIEPNLKLTISKPLLLPFNY
ncbi:MAG: hypothetical protein MJY81_06110 [Bacteroidaceae bacterium]|nr:hypothetical protein [Bacteroidaceae bacterium]